MYIYTENTRTLAERPYSECQVYCHVGDTAQGKPYEVIGQFRGANINEHGQSAGETQKKDIALQAKD